MEAPYIQNWFDKSPSAYDKTATELYGLYTEYMKGTDDHFEPISKMHFGRQLKCLAKGGKIQKRMLNGIHLYTIMKIQ